MPVDCGRLRQIISEFSLVRECDVIRNGYLRISTQFQYLDGSYIDLFLGDLHDLTGEYILTDFGETEGYLSDLPIKLGSSARRRRLVADICESYSVLHSNGEFSVHIHADNFRTLADAIVRLAQVCIRVSDLAMTQRFRQESSFHEELEEFFTESDLKYEPYVQLEGQFGNFVTVEFKVLGATTKSLVQTLSTANASAAHTMTNTVLRGWIDLNHYKDDSNFVTVFDTTNDVVKDYDLRTIQDYSNVVGFPAEQNEFRALLAA